MRNENLQDRMTAALEENRQLRWKLGIFNEQEQRQHTAALETEAEKLADSMIGPDLSKVRGADPGAIERRKAAREAFVAGRAAFLERGL